MSHYSQPFRRPFQRHSVAVPQHGQPQRRQWQRHASAAAGDSSPASSRASGSFDSQDVAEEMLGSSGQRKGASSVSTDALTSRSQDGVGPSPHGHHDHDHGPKIENALHCVLLWIYSHTGAQRCIDISVQSNPTCQL